METFSCKISGLEDKALNSLANRWSCNRAEAARRAIKLAHIHTENSAALDINKSELKEILASQKQTIDLLVELTKYTPLMARINRLEEFAVQGCLSAGVLAKQAGLFDIARSEYINWKQNKENQK